MKLAMKNRTSANIWCRPILEGSNAMTEWTEAHRAIFFPYTTEAHARVQGNGFRFAYYTTADTAIRILKSKSIWLRNAALMNDFSEVQHGFECLREALPLKGGQSLSKALGTAGFDVLDREWKSFKARADDRGGLLESTYLACISEHRPNDQEGRLSMWRAYGGNTGVAFVFNGRPMFSESDALGIYSSPVFYGRVPELDQELQRIAERIAANQELVAALGEQMLLDTLFQMFWFGSVCTKHPAFEEEREWRVIGSPNFFDMKIPSSIETIGGTPQRVYRLEFKDMAEQGIEGLHFDALVEQVLIGPCDHPGVIAEALEDEMKAAGITNPGARIQFTYIPLRPNQR